MLKNIEKYEDLLIEAIIMALLAFSSFFSVITVLVSNLIPSRFANIKKTSLMIAGISLSLLLVALIFLVHLSLLTLFASLYLGLIIISLILYLSWI